MISANNILEHLLNCNTEKGAYIPAFGEVYSSLSSVLMFCPCITGPWYLLATLISSTNNIVPRMT